MYLIRLLVTSSWKVLVIAAITSLLSGLTTTGIIAIINNSEVEPLGVNKLIIIGFISLCFFRFISNILSQTLLISLAQEVILNLRMLLSKRILESPLPHLEKLGNHRILATLTDDIQSISSVAIILPRVCVNAVIVISCLVYLCWLSPTVFLLILVFLVIGIGSYQLTANKARLFLSLAREQQDKLFKEFRCITEGTKELMLHDAKREILLQDLQETAQSYRHENVVGMSLFAVATSWAQILFFVAIGIVIFLLPTLNNAQSHVLSGYVLTITYLIVPLDSIMTSLTTFSKARVALDKIKLLDLKLMSSDEDSDQDRLRLTSNKEQTHPNSVNHELPQSDQLISPLQLQCLELSHVTYTYHNEIDDSVFTVGSIDLKFYPGEIVFLIGGNGSGKSTLIKILTGLYYPVDGKILLNSQEINAANTDWYKQHFSVVFFDFYLFENCLNSGKIISDENIHDYLVKLQLNDKVKVNNGVLSTITLSQGQRKRLALLSAYLEDRPIYVFDEWAADQDPVFKNVFYTQILPDLKHKGKLVIAITHDDQYYHLSDRIIKLNNGKIEHEILPEINLLLNRC
jgi:putative pyoverdin transport system ATP-binding/permease protein